MLEGTATLVVDLGNSTTKCRVRYGKDAAGKFFERDYELSNSFNFIPSDYVPAADYTEDNSVILDVNTIINGHEVKGLLCNGALCEKEFPSGALRPTANQKKYASVESALSLRLALLQGYRELARMNRVGLDQVNVDWNVVALLPPGDMKAGRDKMIEMIKGITVVKSVMPAFESVIRVREVMILPEGFAAYCGVIYESMMAVREDYAYLADETVIVFDVGAGTTDCLIIKDGGLIQDSLHTVTQGGNNVFSQVRKTLGLQGIDIDDDTLRKGVLDGYIKDGAKKVSIVDMVNEAKEKVARSIAQDFRTHLESSEVKARSVGYILVCGGGVVKQNGVSKTLGDSVVESFKQYSPNCERVSLPRVVVSREDENGALVKREEEISPRILNLIGASNLSSRLG